MSNLGLGVLISQVFGDGGASEKAYNRSKNKKIHKVSLEDNTLKLIFVDGSWLRFMDGGQSCCESRFMTCDDPLDAYQGAVFLEAGIEDAPDIPDGGEAHEVQFLRVKTSKGVLVVSNHNRHNGYYGGFSIQCSASNPEGTDNVIIPQKQEPKLDVDVTFKVWSKKEKGKRKKK